MCNFGKRNCADGCCDDGCVEHPSNKFPKSEVSSQFEREERYIVLKKTDLSDDMLREALAIKKGVDFARAVMEEPKRSYLVVESDWPEYEPTWKAIEARMVRPPARLQQVNTAMARK